jgi:hypothetical protein
MERKMRILRNAARCKNCGEVIESKSVHDWVCCTCFHESNGKTGIFVDGGTTYLRSGGYPEYFESLVESRPYTDEERDEYNRQRELFAEQYGWATLDYME